MTETVELKPCPFCGQSMIEIEGFSNRMQKYMGHPDNGCFLAGSRVIISRHEFDQERVIAWNTRSVPAVRDTVTDEMVERVRERYTCAPVPPCSVCGEPLSIQSAGGGNATVYGCEKHSPFDMEHYGRSRWSQFRPGDQDVLDIIAALRTSPPEPASGLQTDFAFTLQPMDSAPSGEDVLEPSEIDVHDGAWAVVLGTNAKPIGWIDTHALFNGRTYRNRLIAPTPPAKEPQ